MTGKAIRAVRLWCAPLAAVALVWLIYSSTAHAVDPQPVLVFQNPTEGEVIQQSAFGIQLCFATPVNIKDLDKGGDFVFSVKEPDGLGLGSRDVFQPDGYGVTVYPGNPIGGTAGQWKFHFRVTSPDAQLALEGDIDYTVDPNGAPYPQTTPPACVGSGGTASVSPVPSETAIATASPVTVATTTASAAAAPTATSISATPTSGAIVAVGASSSSSHTLTYVLVAVVLAGIAAGAVVAGLLMRRRRSVGS